MLLKLCFICFFIIPSMFGLKTPLAHTNPSEVVNEAFSKLSVAKHAVTFFSEDILAPMQLVKNLSLLQNSSLCVQSLIEFAEDIFSILNRTHTGMSNPLQVLDSWGKPESGIFDGNIMFEGRYSECLNSKFNVNVSTQYCGLAVSVPSSLNPLGPLAAVPTATIALCLPTTCTTAELNYFLNPMDTGGIIAGVSCIETDDSWNSKDILATFILCALGFLVCLSTLYDCVSRQRDSPTDVLHDKINRVQSSPDIDQQSRGPEYDAMIQPPSPPRTGTCHRVMLSFSVIRNTEKLLDTTQRPTDITCLHGMRFLSMSWVILCHSFVFILNYVDNLRFIARYTVDHYELQAITNGFFSVDSFFFLSGLLVVYLGMRQLTKRGGKMNVPLMYLYRYLRLTPPYALLILISISLYTKFGDGPFWPMTTQPMVSSCEKYWYTNLLYFNNLYPSGLQSECLAWGWYLANDTQFYLLTPLFLWLLYRNRTIGLSAIGLFLTASITITGAFSSYTKQQPMAMLYGLFAKAAADPPHQSAGGNATLLSGFGASANTTTYSPYIQDLYAKPWCRIGAYLVGMLTGYFLYATNNRFKMNKVTVILGWTAASVINFLLVYCCFPYYSEGKLWGVDLAAFYNAVSRPLWCVGLAWVTIACVNGYGGPVNTLLSWKAFIPLSRLTYCSYLIHPLVISWFVGAAEVQLHFSIYVVVMIYFFALVLTTMLAYVMAMLVEFPVVELLKILQGSADKRPTNTPVYQQQTDENSLLPNGKHTD